jgi:hypothetical protein
MGRTRTSTARSFAPAPPRQRAETRFNDCRALTTQDPSTAAKPRLRAAALIAISAALLASLIVAVSALGTTLLGVPTTYGEGVDSRLGAQVARDFLADQDAEANALSSGDQSLLGGRLSDSALGDVLQQISSQSTSGTPPKVTFQPTSLTILRASDPADPNLTIEVREDGTKSVVTNNGPDQAPSEQSINFHGDFWLRIPSGSHYAIADQHIQTLPSSPLPAISVVAAALLCVALAALLVLRHRRMWGTLKAAPASQPTAESPVIEMPVEDDSPEPVGEPKEMVVSTFGGLHVREGGQDWAQALMSRPVTGFVWLRLLVAAICDPAAPLSRDEIAQQANPRVSRNVQLKRLRNVVAKGLRELPPALRDRVLVTPDVMSFELQGCEVDAIELLKLSSELERRRELTSSQAARVRRVLSACQGTFLTEFEIIEDLATDRHPTCGELMRELRESLTNKRVELSLLLADAYLRSHQPAQAITVLEPAVDDRPQRKDLADRLATAYRGAGREAEAKALEARYA